MGPIFITAATGNIGKHVVRLLQEANESIKIGTRSEPGSQNEVHFDFFDPRSYAEALFGCSSLFLVRPPAISNTKDTLNVLIDQAYEAGVKHIVFVSVSGAENNTIVPHHAVEQKLISSGKSYTILRPGFFSQNLEGPYLDDIILDNRIYLPSGHGVVTFIDARDIADVAFLALTDQMTHSKKEYTLAGNEAATFTQVAQMLSEELGRNIIYTPASVMGYMFHLWKKKLPKMQIIVQTILHYGIRSGQAHIQSDTLSSLLLREPLTIRQYIRDYRGLWGPKEKHA